MPCLNGPYIAFPLVDNISIAYVKDYDYTEEMLLWVRAGMKNVVNLYDYTQFHNLHALKTGKIGYCYVTSVILSITSMKRQIKNQKNT